MKKVLVIGRAGSGKTTFSQKLADKMNVNHIELDELFWQPGWKDTAKAEFRKKIEKATRSSNKGWVLDGNYLKASGDEHWNEADTIIWLDIKLPLIAWRIISRTVKRKIKHEAHVKDNYETWRGAIFSWNSLLMFNLKDPNRSSRRFEKQMSKGNQSQQFVRFKSNKQADGWIKNL